MAKAKAGRIFAAKRDAGRPCPPVEQPSPGTDPGHPCLQKLERIRQANIGGQTECGDAKFSPVRRAAPPIGRVRRASGNNSVKRSARRAYVYLSSLIRTV